MSSVNYQQKICRLLEGGGWKVKVYVSSLWPKI